MFRERQANDLLITCQAVTVAPGIRLACLSLRENVLPVGRVVELRLPDPGAVGEHRDVPVAALTIRERVVVAGVVAVLRDAKV